MFRALVVVAAIAVLVAAAVAIAPASLVNPSIERASGGNVSLAETDGTVWNGRGILAVGNAARIPVAWRLEAWPLLQGEARIALVAPTPAGGAPRAELVVRAGDVSVRAVDATLPAELVAAVAARAGVKLAGAVHVTSPALEWTRTAFNGGARLEWADAQFAIANDAAIRLGKVTGELAAAGDRLTGPVTNEGGDFDVRGTVSLLTSGIPETALTMTPRAGNPAQTRSLTVTARPDRNGWNVNYQAGSR
jgi:hypothetical protein